MKTGYLVLFLSLFILGGCAIIDVESIFKSSPQVQKFLNEYPNADIRITHFSIKESVAELPNMQEVCDKQVTEPLELYKAEIIDEESGLRIIAYLSAETQTIDCVRRFSAGLGMTADGGGGGISVGEIPGEEVSGEPVDTTDVAVESWTRDPRTKGRSCEVDLDCKGIAFPTVGPGKSEDEYNGESLCFDNVCVLHDLNQNAVECSALDARLASTGSKSKIDDDSCFKNHGGEYYCGVIYSRIPICDESQESCRSLKAEVANEPPVFRCIERDDVPVTSGKRCRQDSDCSIPSFTSFGKETQGIQTCKSGSCLFADESGALRACNILGESCPSFATAPDYVCGKVRMDVSIGYDNFGKFCVEAVPEGEELNPETTPEPTGQETTPVLVTPEDETSCIIHAECNEIDEVCAGGKCRTNDDLVAELGAPPCDQPCENCDNVMGKTFKKSISYNNINAEFCAECEPSPSTIFDCKEGFTCQDFKCI